MRKAIETLKNIWKIEDLRQRILITILFVAIYRFGSYVVLPGINPGMLTQLHQQTSEGLLALLNMFSGGAFSNASIFALGIMPLSLHQSLSSCWESLCRIFRNFSEREKVAEER